MRVNTRAHKAPGYAIAMISLKPTGGAPGDATADQMRAMADAADSYSLGELRVTAEQNIVLPYVKKSDLFALWQDLDERRARLANAEMISDVVSCPGMDYCALATARSIPIAQEITERFADAALQEKIGPIRIKISGCINACGHHHVGDIGILGLEKTGAEAYQITLGGDPTETRRHRRALRPRLSRGRRDRRHRAADPLLSGQAAGWRNLQADLSPARP